MYTNDVTVSIILPVYNGQKYIGESISSVLNQSFTDWELLIINDGSTDQTEKEILTFSDERIRYFKQFNKGVSAARNVGLKNMNGTYFCFLDSDDILPIDSLKSRLEVFKKNEDLNFVDGKIDCFDIDLKKVIRSWLPAIVGNPLEDLVGIGGNSFFGPSWMIKRLPDIKYRFKEGLTHGEDLLFYIQLAVKGGKYNYTNKSVLYYRTGNNSAMTNLKGLENGYSSIYSELKNMNGISKNLLKGYKRKIKSIMFKSYLSRFQFINAIKVWVK